MTDKETDLNIALKQLEARKKVLNEILEFGEKNILFAECIAKRNNPSKILISSPYVKIALLSELNAIDKALFYLEKLKK